MPFTTVSIGALRTMSRRRCTSISKATVNACSEHIQRMLGYSIHRPFVGMVDGMHPKRLLES